MYKICIINKYYWRMAYNEKLLPDFYQIKLLLVQEFLITTGSHYYNTIWVRKCLYIQYKFRLCNCWDIDIVN